MFSEQSESISERASPQSIQDPQGEDNKRTGHCLSNHNSDTLLEETEINSGTNQTRDRKTILGDFLYRTTSVPTPCATCFNASMLLMNSIQRTQTLQATILFHEYEERNDTSSLISCFIILCPRMKEGLLSS